MVEIDMLDEGIAFGDVAAGFRVDVGDEKEDEIDDVDDAERNRFGVLLVEPVDVGTVIELPEVAVVAQSVLSVVQFSL
jgi:hypothetical protein